jgi:hypothetical protein
MDKQYHLPNYGPSWCDETSVAARVLFDQRYSGEILR